MNVLHFEVGNYYGCLSIKEDEDGLFYWSIENYDGNHWQEIPEELFKCLNGVLTLEQAIALS